MEASIPQEYKSQAMIKMYKQSRKSMTRKDKQKIEMLEKSKNMMKDSNKLMSMA